MDSTTRKEGEFFYKGCEDCAWTDTENCLKTKEREKMKFREIAQEICNGCDLVTGEENKLKTEDVTAQDQLTLDDFAVCEIDGKKVGVVTFEEFPGKYYWGGMSLSNMVNEFIKACGNEVEARDQYAIEKKTEPIKMHFEIVKTKSKNTFVQVTVL